MVIVKVVHSLNGVLDSIYNDFKKNKVVKTKANVMSIFNKVITKVFGKKSDKDLKKISPIVNQINDEYIKLEQLTDDELKLKFS